MNRVRFFRYAAPIAAAILVMSCGEPGATGPGVPVTGRMVSDQDGGSSLLQCKPLAYDSTTQVVGPSGASLRVSKHVLFIPPGAVIQPIAITVVAPSDTVNRIQFQPEGLTFRKPIALTMSYQNCNLGWSESARIVYTSDSLRVLEDEPSLDDYVGKKVTGALRHFSQYAVSW